jgi:hypothetical protein
LNHLLLKAVIRPDHTAELHQSAGRLVDGYLGHVDWEPAAELTSRVAALLPLLALARVDGASPVEYLTAPHRATVRGLARARLSGPPSSVDAFVGEWMVAVGSALAGATQTREATAVTFSLPIVRLLGTPHHGRPDRRRRPLPTRRRPPPEHWMGGPG